MLEPPKLPPITWNEIGVLALVGGVIALALYFNGYNVVEKLLCGTVVLLIALAWNRTLQNLESETPMTRRQRILYAMPLVAIVAMIVALWWFVR